jgi:hypothetical protein
MMASPVSALDANDAHHEASMASPFAAWLQCCVAVLPLAANRPPTGQQGGTARTTTPEYSMRSMILAALAIMIGIGAANALPKGTAAAPAQQDSTADWTNG